MSQFFFPETLKKKKKPKMLKYFLVTLTGGETGENYSLGLIISPEELATFKQKILTKEQVENLIANTTTRLMELMVNRGVLISDLPDTDEFYDCNNFCEQRIEKGKDKSFRITDARRVVDVHRNIKYPEEWLREVFEEIEGIGQRKVIAHFEQVKEMAKGLKDNPGLAIALMRMDPITFFAPVVKMLEAEKETETLKRFASSLIRSLRNARKRIDGEIASLEWDFKEELRKTRKREKSKEKVC